MAAAGAEPSRTEGSGIAINTGSRADGSVVQERTGRRRLGFCWWWWWRRLV